uniref:hypothetical protein n=1 Tax=Zhongshania sp. TaxID=1971902 RepID=UPI0035676E35
SICVCHSIAWTSKGYRTANLSDEFDALLNPKNRRYGAYYLEQSSSKKSRDVRHTALLLFEQHALQHKIYKEV